MDHNTTTPIIFRPVSQEKLLSLWSTVDAADDFAQGANDRRESYIIPALREAATELRLAVTYAQQAGASDPGLDEPLPRRLFDPAEVPSPTLAREEVIKLAGEMWCALSIARSGPQTYENLTHLYRLTMSLLHTVALSVFMDRY